MKILVSGVTGFIGTHVVKALVEQDHTVFAIVREDSDVSGVTKKVKIFRYDGNIEALITFFKEEKFDGVIHLASLFLASHNEKKIISLISSNIQFGTELLEASVQSNVKWFINTGTFWQNYHSESYNPVNLYAATKEAFEVIAKFYMETSNITFTTIKLNDTFGPNDTRNKIFNLWAKIAKTGETLGMSHGEQIIDICYIKDIVNAYLVMIDNLTSVDSKSYKNKTYLVSNNEKMTLKELSKVFEEVTNSTLNINWGERDYRDREVMLPYAKGENVPNWKQEYTLKDAIKETIKDMKSD